jgi:hypothetical protein
MLDSVSDICGFVGSRSVPNSSSIANALAAILPEDTSSSSFECIYVLGRCCDQTIHVTVPVKKLLVMTIYFYIPGRVRFHRNKRSRIQWEKCPFRTVTESGHLCSAQCKRRQRRSWADGSTVTVTMSPGVSCSLASLMFD